MFTCKNIKFNSLLGLNKMINSAEVAVIVMLILYGISSNISIKCMDLIQSFSSGHTPIKFKREMAKKVENSK